MKVMIMAVAVIAATALSISIYLFSNKAKVAYVHNDRLITEYHGFKDAQKEYRQNVEVMQQNLDSLTTDFNQKAQQYLLNKDKLKEAQRKEQEMLLQLQEKDVQNYKLSIEQTASAKEQEMNTALYTQINEFVKQYSKEQGYDYVYGVTDYGNIMYASEENDITEQLLEAINQKYEGEH